MQVRPLSTALGVEIRDASAGELLRSHRREIRALVDAHHLVCVRASGASAAEQVGLCRAIGPVVAESGDGSGTMLVSNTREDAIIREGALLFHSDLAFTAEPMLGIGLQAIELPPSGTVTRFANAARALERLPGDLRARIEGLHALHLFSLTTQRGDARYRDAETPAGEPRAVHPVVLRNPRKGSHVLYVSRMQTDRIVELDPDESETLLAELLEGLYAPDNVYAHHWEPGDLLIWDNHDLQHARDVPGELPRTLRRVAIAHRGMEALVPGFQAPRFDSVAPA